MRAYGAAAGLLATTLLAGCSSSSASPSLPDASATCPSTIQAVLAASCSAEGLLCYPQYACGIASAIATCTCTGGVFECTDVAGKSVGEGGQPSCPPASSLEACPTSEAIAEGRACTEPGLLCPYPSTCSGTQEYDECQCANGALANGQTGLRFECTTPCDYDAGLVDAPSTMDASTAADVALPSEASVDAHVAKDGAVDGASTDSPSD